MIEKTDRKVTKNGHFLFKIVIIIYMKSKLYGNNLYECAYVHEDKEKVYTKGRIIGNFFFKINEIREIEREREKRGTKMTESWPKKEKN
jgi:hypothetical protein